MTSPPTPRDLSGAWRVHASDGDLARRFTDPSISDADWPEVPVPGHWQSTAAFAGNDGPMLYRRTYDGDPLEPGNRRFLTFDGIFYDGDIWLDGGYIGATAGYFFPHTFEVTDQARQVPDGGHLLAVEVASPPQRDRTKKRTITGVFSHWDNLDPDWNPGGIWRSVRLRDTGPVRIKWLRALCTEATETRGRLLLDVTLDSGPDPDPVPLGARLYATVTGPDGRTMAATTRDVMLAAGDNTLNLTVEVDHPPRWWPWRLGDQPQCDVEVVVEVDGVPSDDRRLRTAFREVRFKSWQLSVNGERMFPMGSNHGPSRMALAEASVEELIRDVNLAVDANLDLLRIHAHVTRLELYDAADAAGLLLWQDLPLQWGYARGTRKEAVRQAREMVDLLGHHPSIAMWCAHNEPLAIDLQPGDAIRARDVAKTATSMFLPTWNKDVLDRSIARALHKADPTRAVNAHSGVLPGLSSAGTDTHFYFGWYHGKMDGLAPALRAISAPGALRHRVRCAGGARLRRVHAPRAVAEPRLGRPLRAPRAPEAVLRPPRPTGDVRVVRGVAGRDPALPGRVDPAPDRGPPPAQARPHRRLLPLLLRGRSSVGHLVGARSHPQAEGRVLRPPRRLPDRAADARAPRRADPRRQ